MGLPVVLPADTPVEVAEDGPPRWTTIRLERGSIIARRIEIPQPADDSPEERAAFSHQWDLFRGRAWEHAWCKSSKVGPLFAMFALTDYDAILAADGDPFDTLIPGAVALAKSTAAMRAGLPHDEQRRLLDVRDRP